MIHLVNVLIITDESSVFRTLNGGVHDSQPDIIHNCNVWSLDDLSKKTGISPEGIQVLIDALRNE